MSSPGPFAALPPQVDLPALEQDILQRWEADKVFARTLEGSAGKPQWVFYEGPPTANGRPGTHHIEARAFKDVFPPVQDHAGLPRPPPRRLGLPRPARRDRRRAGTRLRRQAGHRALRHRGVQRPLPGVRRAARRLVHRAHPPDGLLGRHVHGLLDDEPELHRERLVVAQADLREGPAGRGPPRRPLLPALRHRPLRPRGRPGVRDPDRPVGLRAPPGHVRRVGRQGRLAHLDDDAVDAAVEHGRRDAPGRDVRRRPPRAAPTTCPWWSPSRCSAPSWARTPRYSAARPDATGSG